MLVQIGNRFVATGNEQEWEDLWRAMTELGRSQHGFISARLLRSNEHRSKYTLINEWQDEESWSRYFHLPEMQEMTRRSYRLFSGPPLQEWFAIIQETAAERS